MIINLVAKTDMHLLVDVRLNGISWWGRKHLTSAKLPHHSVNGCLLHGDIEY